MVLALVACAPAPPRAAGAARAPGRPLPYQYYFDHNALRFAIVGGNVIALTRSGHVLRFEAYSLALTGERLFSRRARVMGGADGAGPSTIKASPSSTRDPWTPTRRG